MSCAPVVTVCARCGEEFEARNNYTSFKQKHCSQSCANRAMAEKKVASYPPKDVVEALIEEGLSDVRIGRKFGRSYNWAFNLRKHYGLGAGGQTKGPRKTLVQKNARSRWGIHLKREEACRACKQSVSKLSLHHAVPRSLAPAIKFDLRNGLPLCDPCHMGWHHHNVTIYRDAFTEDEWSFLWGLEFVGIRIQAWLRDHYPERSVGASWPWDVETCPECEEVPGVYGGRCWSCRERSMLA